LSDDQFPRANTPAQIAQESEAASETCTLTTPTPAAPPLPILHSHTIKPRLAYSITFLTYFILNTLIFFYTVSITSLLSIMSHSSRGSGWRPDGVKNDGEKA
jgi:hypothetical protein